MPSFSKSAFNVSLALVGGARSSRGDPDRVKGVQKREVAAQDPEMSTTPHNERKSERVHILREQWLCEHR